jgi:hypothetical protein
MKMLFTLPYQNNKLLTIYFSDYMYQVPRNEGMEWNAQERQASVAKLINDFRDGSN